MTPAMSYSEENPVLSKFLINLTREGTTFTRADACPSSISKIAISSWIQRDGHGKYMAREKPEAEMEGRDTRAGRIERRAGKCGRGSESSSSTRIASGV